MKVRDGAMPYWRLPDRLYDDADEFIAHSENALAVAMHAATLKTKSKNTKKAPRADTAKSGAKEGARRGRRSPLAARR